MGCPVLAANDIVDQGVNSLRFGIAQGLLKVNGDIHGVNDAAAHGVLNVMVNISNAVRKPKNLSLQSLRFLTASMAQDASPHLIGQVESISFFLQNLHHPQRLDIVGKTIGHNIVEDALAGMPEGGVP